MEREQEKIEPITVDDIQKLCRLTYKLLDGSENNKFIRQGYKFVDKLAEKLDERQRTIR